MHYVYKVLLLFCAFAVVSTIASDVTAQSSRRDNAIAGARSLVNARQYSAAIERATWILNRWPNDVDALLVRARAHLFSSNPDPSRAKADLRKVQRIDEGNLEAEELDLWRSYRFSDGFLSAARNTRRLQRARGILETDSTSDLAHLVIGLIHLADYRDVYREIEFEGFSRPGSSLDIDDRVVDAAAYVFEPELVERNGRETLVFHDPYIRGRKIDITFKESAASESAAHATRHLREAARSASVGLMALRYLVEAYLLSGAYENGKSAARNMMQLAPDHAEGYLFLGMFLGLQKKLIEAESSFRDGLSRVDSSLEIQLLDSDRFGVSGASTDAVVSIQSLFWNLEDPAWSTPTNEALVEHLTRMLIADLRFGNSAEGKRGWQTEPGDLIVRYGLPRVEAQYGSLTESYWLMHYGERHFIFMDLARSDSYTYYNVSAASLTGPRSVAREWENDYTIVAREAFRELPRTVNFGVERIEPLTAQASRFYNPDSEVVSVTYCLRDGWTGTDISESVYHLPAFDGPPRPVTSVRSMGQTVVSDPDCDSRLIEARSAKFGAHASLEVTHENMVGVHRFQLPQDVAEGNGHYMSDLLPALLVEETPAVSRDGSTSVSTGEFRRPGFSIIPSASSRFVSGSALYLYFESYDIDAGPGRPAQFEIQAALLPDDESPGVERALGRIFGRTDASPVSVDYREAITSSTDRRYIILDTSDLDEGRYVVAVRLTDLQSGLHAESRRVIHIDAP